MRLSIVFIGGLFIATAAIAAPPNIDHLRSAALRNYNRMMEAQQATTLPPSGPPQGSTMPPSGPQGSTMPPSGPQGSTMPPSGPGGSMPPQTTGAGMTGGGPAPTEAGGFGNGFDDHTAPDICRRGSEFQIASDRVATVCAGANYTVLRDSTKYINAQQADADWHDFCTSFCVSTMSGFMQFQQFAPCLNQETNSFIAPILALCQLRNGRYCGATLSMVSPTCENPRVARNQTACMATTGCTWDATDGCQDNNGTVILDRMCDPCVQDLLSSFGPESDEAQNLTFACKKIGGKYCQLEVGQMVPQLRSQGIDWFTTQNLNAVCAPSAVAKYQCLLFYAGKDFTNRMQNAATAFPECTSRDSTANCLKKLRDTQKAVFDDSRRLALMCDGHNTSNGVDYCLPKIPSLFANECFRQATGAVLPSTTMPPMQTSGMTVSGSVQTTAMPMTTTGVTGGSPTMPPTTCNSTCNTELVQLLNVGCCIGTIDEYFRVVYNFTLDDVPVVSDLAATDLPPALAPPVNLNSLTICAGLTNITNQTKDLCVIPPAATPPRDLHLRINASYLLGKPALRDRLMNTIFDDLASLLGLRGEDFVDGFFSSNKSVTFAGNQSGVTLTFKIHTRREDVQVFAANEYDKLFAADQIVLTQTAKFLKQCKLCVGRSGVADFIVTHRAPLQLPATVRGDPCMTTQYFNMEINLDRVCGPPAALDALSFHEGRTKNATRDLVGQMCQGECFKRLQEAAKSPFARCLPADISAIAALLGVACSRDGPAFCGESLVIVDQLQCEQWQNDTSCKMRPQCVWNTKKNACYNDPSSDFLEPLCQSCMGRFVAAMAGEEGSLAKLIVSTDAVLCSRDGKALCRPLVSKELSQASDEGFSEPLTKELCNNATKRRCFKRVYAGEASQWRQAADDAFNDCAVTQNFEPEKVFQQCVPALFSALKDTERFEDITSKMCIVHPATSQPCLGFAEKFADDSCVNAVMQQQTCNSTCDAHLKTIFDAMGCCAGVIHSIFGRESNLRNDDLPNFGEQEDFAGGNGPTLPPTTTAAAPSPTTLPPIVFGTGENASNVDEVVPTEGFMRQWAICPSLSDIATSATGLRKVCAKPREAAKVVRELPMGVAFDRMQGKTGRRMLSALMRDLSNKLGLSADDFPGTKFAEDRNRTIVTSKQSAAARRGFWAQQTAGTNAPTTAATVSITMSASKSEDGTAASAQFDSLVASGSLTLPSTVKTAGNECKGCTSSSGGTTSLQSAATITTLTSNLSTTTAAPSPGAASMNSVFNALLAIVATCALLLL